MVNHTWATKVTIATVEGGIMGEGPTGQWPTSTSWQSTMATSSTA